MSKKKKNCCDTHVELCKITSEYEGGGFLMGGQELATGLVINARAMDSTFLPTDHINEPLSPDPPPLGEIPLRIQYQVFRI